MKGANVFGRLTWLVFFVYASAASAGTTNGPWIWQRPQITGARLNAIAQVIPGGELVAVGDAGVVLTSADGNAWTSVRTLYGDYTTNVDLDGTNLTAVTYWNGMFIAGGDSDVLTSTDGKHWSAATVDQIDDTSLSISAFAVAGSHIVATGGAGDDSLYESSDGKAWMLVTSLDFRPNGAAQALNGMFYVTVWNSLIASTELEVSADGRSWSHDTSYPTASPNSMASSGTLLLAMDPQGHLYSTSDGAHWSAALATPMDTGSLQWTGREFVLLSTVSSNYYTSADGTSWTSHTLASDVLNLLWTGSQYVAIGLAGAIYTSPDGDTWTAVSTPGTEAFNTAIWDGTKFLVYGQSRAQLAGDGTSWTSTPLTGSFVGSLLAVVKGDQAFLAANVGQIEVSNDGIAWQSGGLISTHDYLMAVQCGNTAAAFSQAFPGSGAWVASANASSGFLTWTEQQTAFIGPPLGMACGNGVFVANFQQSIATSTDGLNWSPQQVSSTAIFDAVTFQNGMFILVGQNGEMYTSTDATHWTHIEPVSAQAPQTLTTLVWDGGEYIGMYSGLSAVWTSHDLKTWYEDVSLPGLRPIGIAGGGGHALLVSFNGQIAESAAGAGNPPSMPAVNLTAPDLALTSVSGQCLGSDPSAQSLVYEITDQNLGSLGGQVKFGSLTGAFSMDNFTFSNKQPITFLCRVSNGLMITASLVTISPTEAPPSGGGTGGPPPSGGGSASGGGGALGWLSLLMLLGVGVVRAAGSRKPGDDRSRV